MRYIRLLETSPDVEWLQKADQLLEALEAAKDDESRLGIIEKNSHVWGELKTWLLALSHGKCWFSEAKDCFSHWDVEHYRPKKSAKDDDGTENGGYWWLAFCWKNLRICGNAGNRKKGAYFPLRHGTSRCQALGDHRYEHPVLLDPVDEDDPLLLFFNFEGRAIAAPHVTDEWEQKRVTMSVVRYNLDFPPLMEKRKIVWAECWSRLQEYLNELSLLRREPTNVLARAALKTAARRVRELIRDDMELSGVARACVVSTGDRRLLGLLQSA